MDFCLSNNNKKVLEEATASLEHGFNDLSIEHGFNDLSICGIHHCHKHRAGDDETSGHFLGMAIGDKDESDPWVPRVGMEFDSEVALYNFFCNYAKQTGFNVRRGKVEYSGSNKATVRAKYFLCSSQGHKSAMRKGCDAKIKCVNDVTWKISKIVLEHNQVKTALSTGRIADEVRTVGEQALVSDADHSDVSRGTRKNHPRPAPEETQDLIDYFKFLMGLDCCSFYSLQVVEARGMENFFWRDSRCKLDYEHFSDLLVLDTRTWIDKYGMICATFWGLNHHGQPTIFGHGLLVDQTVGSLHWLLDSFLASMNWQKPQTIITELSKEIAEAVSLVLPETCHCLPAWSILNNFRKYLSPLSDQLDVVNHFKECVFLDSQEEFESKWNSFIGKYELHDNSWLASLYKMHEKWSHAFTKNVFSVGLLSIQNDEDAGHIVGNLSSETMTLTEIAWQCEQTAKMMRREEFHKDMLCEKSTVNLKTGSPMEKEAARLYTRTIFEMFLDEFINIMKLAIEEIKSTETLRMFQLTEEGSTTSVSGRKTQTVKFDPFDSTVACSCGKFESVGILCVHALKVLNFMNIFETPSRYLLKRWTKSAKDSLPEDTPSARPARGGGPVDSFTGEFMRKALHVAHMSVNKKRKRIAMRFMDLALERIAKAPKTEEVAAACPRAKRKVGGDRPAEKRVSLIANALAH